MVRESSVATGNAKAACICRPKGKSHQFEHLLLSESFHTRFFIKPPKSVLSGAMHAHFSRGKSVEFL